MASIINAALSGGLISTGDTSGQLQLQTAGTTALSISSAQAITVNGLITSNVGNSGFILRGSSATNSYIYPVYVTNTSGGVQLALEGASGGNVLVGGTAYATVLTTTTNTPVEIGINTTRVGSFSSTGLSMVKSVGVGNTTPSSSGSGITFPTTQDPSSNANTLDDYEEGTWTASLGGTTTYSNQSGVYTKIGNLVVATAYLDILLIGTGSQYLVTGLPFAQSSTPAISGSGGVGYFYFLATNVVSVFARSDSGSAYVVLSSMTSAGTNVSNNAILTNGSRMAFTVSYQTST